MAEMINHPERPIQLIFAGKAHPRDVRGKEYIRRILDICQQSEFLGKVVFLENYDMNVARQVISGADLWLNTPRRPLEASGTSGQKVSVHGGLNLSVLDGWWREGYDGTNGWAIGGDDHPADEAAQDKADLESLYRTLSRNIVPLFFERDSRGIPRGWIAKIRRAVQTLVPRYNTDRMVTRVRHPLLPAQKQGGWRNSRHPREWLSSLRRFAFPRIGKVPVSEVTSADVLEILTPIWHRKIETARWVRQRLRAVLEWAVAMEYRLDNPCDRIGPVLGPQQDVVEHRQAVPRREAGAVIRRVRASFPCGTPWES